MQPSRILDSTIQASGLCMRRWLDGAQLHEPECGQENKVPFSLGFHGDLTMTILSSWLSLNLNLHAALSDPTSCCLSAAQKKQVRAPWSASDRPNKRGQFPRHCAGTLACSGCSLPRSWVITRWSPLGCSAEGLAESLGPSRPVGTRNKAWGEAKLAPG